MTVYASWRHIGLGAHLGDASPARIRMHGPGLHRADGVGDGLVQVSWTVRQVVTGTCLTHSCGTSRRWSTGTCLTQVSWTIRQVVTGTCLTHSSATIWQVVTGTCSVTQYGHLLADGVRHLLADRLRS